MQEVYAELEEHHQTVYPIYNYVKRMDLPDPMLQFRDPKAYRRQFQAALRTCQNAKIQGLCAFIVKEAIVQINDDLEAEGLDAFIAYQIHDEIGVLAHKSVARRVIEIMEARMTRTINGVELTAEADIKFTMSKLEAPTSLEALEAMVEEERLALFSEGA